jgi:hypothetical protein
MSIRANLTILLLILVAAVNGFAQLDRNRIEIMKPANYTAPVITVSDDVQKVINAAITDALAKFESKGLKPEHVSATLIDVRDPKQWRMAEVRGNEPIYPASVVKMFYMAALMRQIEDGKVISTPEMNRGLRDMIVDSSNEATQYILDVLTDTSSGAELPAPLFDAWQYKRNRVNRFFASMGYRNINVNQKTFCEDAYGIEQQSRNYRGENRNMITTDATARLMAEIAGGRLANAANTSTMMNLMKRDPFAPNSDADSHATGFSGKALIDRKLTTAKLWSKAGWTSRTRHDAAYFELADGRKFVLAIYTQENANNREVIPTIVGRIIDELK